MVYENSRERAIRGRAAGFGSVHINSLRTDPFEHVPRHLHCLGIFHADGHTLAEKVRAKSDVVELIAQQANIIKTPHRRGYIAISSAVGKLDGSGVQV